MKLDLAIGRVPRLFGCTPACSASWLLAADDLPLARGHFGTAWRIGQRAIQNAGDPRPVPYGLPANQAFHESGKGLVWCLLKLDKADLATEVVNLLVSCDPSDPLGLRRLIAEGIGKKDTTGRGVRREIRKRVCVPCPLLPAPCPLLPAPCYFGTTNSVVPGLKYGALPEYCTDTLSRW